MSSPAEPTPASIADAVKARLKARYRAERRFRTYGALAIGFAGLALVTLVLSIASQATRAFTIHELTLPITFAEDAFVGDTADPAVIRSAAFQPMRQQALQEAFPEVESVAQLRALFELLSRGNDDVLREIVLDDPSVIGTSRDVAFPISDDADLYLKGHGPGRVARRVEARWGASAPDGVRFEVEGRGFDDLVARARRALLDEADRVAEDAAAAMADALTHEPESRARARSERRADNLMAQAEALVAAAGEGASAVELGPMAPALFLAVGEGVMRVERVDGAAVVGQALVPFAPGSGTARAVFVPQPESARRITDEQIAWAEALMSRGAVERVFNHRFFTSAASAEPEFAGILGALVGSILTMLVTMALAAPIGVATAVYLEEFAPKNRLTDLVEVNINNLAAVPSIVFGLLGLAIFINGVSVTVPGLGWSFTIGGGAPQSAPLVGGMVLALMTLPTIIIATRAALRAVPDSIRQGALAVGASKVQMVFHHVLPLALPGIMTGSIIGLAQALGETAPLLMIGMVAFVADVPASLTDPATALPVQVYLFSQSAERAFESRTALAIVVLLAVMIILNLAAVLVRRRFTRRW